MAEWTFDNVQGLSALGFSIDPVKVTSTNYTSLLSSMSVV